MSFNKEFFERIREHVEEYRKHSFTNVVSLSIRLYERELNVYKFLDCRDELLTFAYYDQAKQRKLPAKVRDETGETDAFPALTVPYAAILWVEVNPGKADGRHDDLGFQFEKR